MGMRKGSIAGVSTEKLFVIILGLVAAALMVMAAVGVFQRFLG